MPYMLLGGFAIISYQGHGGCSVNKLLFYLLFIYASFPSLRDEGKGFCYVDPFLDFRPIERECAWGSIQKGRMTLEIFLLFVLTFYMFPCNNKVKI